MSVYKEDLYVLEQMMRKQTRIFPDSMDFGYRLNASDKSKARDAIQSLRDYCPSRMTKSSCSSTTDICIPIERESRFQVSCLIVTVDYVKCNSVEYLYVHEARELLSEGEIATRFSTRRSS